jgi:hypothetical protein
LTQKGNFFILPTRKNELSGRTSAVFPPCRQNKEDTVNSKKSDYEMNLNKNSTNFVPLSPLSFIERTKDVYPKYASVIYGDRTYTWLETLEPTPGLRHTIAA